MQRNAWIYYAEARQNKTDRSNLFGYFLLHFITQASPERDAEREEYRLQEYIDGL